MNRGIDAMDRIRIKAPSPIDFSENSHITEDSGHVFTPEDEVREQLHQISANRSSMSARSDFRSPHKNSSINLLKNMLNPTCKHPLPTQKLSNKQLLEQQKSCKSFNSIFSFFSKQTNSNETGMNSNRYDAENPQENVSRNPSVFSNRSNRLTDGILNELNNREQPKILTQNQQLSQNTPNPMQIRRNSLAKPRRGSVVASNKELKQNFRRQSIQGAMNRRKSLAYEMLDNSSILSSVGNSGISSQDSSTDCEAIFIDGNKHRDNMNNILKMMGSKAKIQKRRESNQSARLSVLSNLRDQEPISDIEEEAEDESEQKLQRIKSFIEENFRKLCCLETEEKVHPRLTMTTTY